MKSLYSMANMGKATTVTAIGVLMAFLFLAPIIANATSYTVTVSTDKSSYVSGNMIIVSGTITPAPPAGTEVHVTITNPSGATVGSVFVAPNASGSYTTTSSGVVTTIVAGGNTNWVSGNYTASAIWAANSTGLAYTQTASFQYNAGNTTTSSSCSCVNVTTTIVSDVTTTIVENSGTVTTVAGPGVTTVISQAGATVTSIITEITTIQSGGGGVSGADLPVAVVGVVIAVIAGALSVVALRRH